MITEAFQYFFVKVIIDVIGGHQLSNLEKKYAFSEICHYLGSYYR